MIEQLPRTVKIGAFDIAIWPMSDDESRRCGDAGQFDAAKSAIYVVTQREPRYVAETLLHEILHACWWDGSLGKDTKEEPAVSVLSYRLAAVFRDNPSLARWLLCCIADRREPGADEIYPTGIKAPKPFTRLPAA